MTDSSDGQSKQSMETMETQNIELQPNVTKNKLSYDNALYDSQHSGPYIVHLMSVNTRLEIGIRHPLSISRKLYADKSSNINELKPIGRNLIKITFKDGKSANKFLKHPILQQNNWKAYIPYYAVYSIGVIKGVDADITEEEIKTDIECNAKIVHVRRIYYHNKQAQQTTYESPNTHSKNNSFQQKTPSRTVVITFKSQYLPRDCRLYYLNFPIETYIPPLKQCYGGCYRFGHLKKNCKSKSNKCLNCGGEHNAKQCQEQTCCINCKKDHNAIHKECPERLRQIRMNEYMIIHKTSYNEAAQQFTSKTGFNQIAQQYNDQRQHMEYTAKQQLSNDIKVYDETKQKATVDNSWHLIDNTNKAKRKREDIMQNNLDIDRIHLEENFDEKQNEQNENTQNKQQLETIWKPSIIKSPKLKLSNPNKNEQISEQKVEDIFKLLQTYIITMKNPTKESIRPFITKVLDILK